MFLLYSESGANLSVEPRMQFKNLNRYRTGGTHLRPQLGVPLPRTPGGRVYRYSPNEEAYPRHFVLGDVADGIEISAEARARMKLDPHSEQTVCPYSGVVAPDQAFTHPDDRDAAVEIVKHAAVEDVRAELQRMLEGVARNSRGMIKYTPGRAAPKPKPRFARRDLMRELVCDHCGRDYGVFAIALFCPDCGAPNLRLHFEREAALVDAQVDLAEGLEDGQQELAYRLLGNAHEDVLTAVEATLKTVYLYGMARQSPGAPSFKPVQNDFQNVDRAKNRFADLGFDPFEELDDAHLSILRLNIQKRHIIGHNLGVVDAKFAEHAQDARVGETVHLVGEDIRIFAALSQVVVDRLDTWLAGGLPAPVSLTEPDPAPAAILTPAEPPAEATLDDLNIGAVARRMGRWLIEQSTNGLTVPVSCDALLAAFPDDDLRGLEDAVAELEAEGLVTTTHTLNGRLPHVRATLDLFAAFDPVVLGQDPTRDAGELAKMALEIGDGISVAELHKLTGWPLRRFNPALGLLVAEIDERRVSKALDSEYVTTSFHLMADDRLALKRLATRVGAAD
jgi:hypothetical protein